MPTSDFTLRHGTLLSKPQTPRLYDAVEGSIQVMTFSITKALTIVGDQSFTVTGPRVWNTLLHLTHSRPSVNDLTLDFSENHFHTAAFYFSCVYS